MGDSAPPVYQPSAVQFQKVTVYPNQAQIEKTILWTPDTVGPAVFEYKLPAEVKNPVANLISSDTVIIDKVVGEVDLISVTRSEITVPVGEQTQEVEQAKAELDRAEIIREQLSAKFTQQDPTCKLLESSLQGLVEPKSESLKTLVTINGGDGAALVDYIASMCKETQELVGLSAEQKIQLQVDLEEARQKEEIARQEYRRLLGGDHSFARQLILRVAVEVRAAGPATFKLTYMSGNAAWTACYDVRANVNELELAYYGEVQQSTNENWDSNIQLFTISPSDQAEPDKLPRLTADFPPPPKPPPAVSPQTFEAESRRVVLHSYANRVEEDYEDDEDMGCDLMSVLDKPAAMAATFVAPDNWSVPSDGVPHRVLVATRKLQPNYIHYCFPESSPKAYRAGEVLNDTDLLLVGSSRASIFWNTNLVAHTDIPQVAPRGKFVLFFGPDDSIEVEQMTEKGVKGQRGNIIVGQTEKETKYQGVALKNRQNVPVKILTAFRVPESTDKTITVSMGDSKLKEIPQVSAKSDIEALEQLNLKKPSAKPTWFLNQTLGHYCALVLLQPDQSVKIDLEYIITFPKGKAIEVFNT